MPDKNALSAIAAYRAQIDFVSSNVLGRPTTVVRYLDRLAVHAAMALQAVSPGEELQLGVPLPDCIDDDSHGEDGNLRPDPGRIDPLKNAGFLQTHRNNLTLLEGRLERV
jgi:hypothetical protein